MILENPDQFKGKKFQLKGKEQLNFHEIDESIQEVYHNNIKHSTPNSYLKRLNNSKQEFFHGNCPALNFEKMLKFYQGRDIVSSYQDLAQEVNFNEMKSFRDYYSKNSEKVDLNKDDLNLDNNEVELGRLTFPLYQNYWNNNLN